ncbi:MAG TPA: NTP transferase domain-containing protein [bacterium]|nr:NTP transferase domain-containing protein [bacterium]
MTTTGLIIAAGAGTRLADETQVPKPLRKVAGLPLLKRIILTAAKAGLTKMIVVVGFEKEKITTFITSQKWPLPVECVENKDWKKSNGLSVLAAKDVLKENFVLLMSDHVFDVHTLQKLIKHGLGDAQARLAVDYKVHQIFDQDDATKVATRNDKVVAIGKNLIEYDAIDTGMFLLSPAIFDALAEAKKDGDCSLSDGIRTLAAKGHMGIFDIGDGFWQDVDTPACLKHAENVLFNACRKPTDGIVSRNFNRHVSLFISKRLVNTPLTANQITFIVLLLGLLSGFLASLGTYTTYLLAAILFKLTSILDGVDGEISKVKLTSSKFGQWLDTLCDNTTYIVFLLGTIVGLFRQHYPYSVVLSLFAGVGLLIALSIVFWHVLKHSNSGSLLALQKDFQTRTDLTLLSRIFFKLHFAIKRDFFSVAFLVFALFGKPQWVMLSTAIAMNLTWIIILQQQMTTLSLAKKKT